MRPLDVSKEFTEIICRPRINRKVKIRLNVAEISVCFRPGDQPTRKSLVQTYSQVHLTSRTGNDNLPNLFYKSKAIR